MEAATYFSGLGGSARATRAGEALHIHQMNCVIVDASKCPARTCEAVILQQGEQVLPDRRLKQ